MAKASSILAFKSASLPPVYNWKEDSQPERYSDPKTYQNLATSLTKESLEFAVDILKNAGYIAPGEEEKTLERLMTLERGSKLELDGVSVCWRVKDVRASNDKILKDHKTADDIGDYFGMKFIADEVSDVVRLRNAILQSENMSSRKCEFTLPSSEGFRSHKSHHTISGGGHRLSIEAMITHSTFEENDKLTHTIMEMERRVLERQYSIRDNRLSHEFEASAHRLRGERTLLNHLCASAAGLNALCAPEVNTEYSAEPLKGYARRIVEGLTPDLRSQRERILEANTNDRFLRRELA